MKRAAIVVMVSLAAIGCGDSESSEQSTTTSTTVAVMDTVLPVASTVCAELTAAANGETTLNFNAVADGVVRDHMSAYFDATGVDPIPDETASGLEYDIALTVDTNCPDVADEFASYRVDFGEDAGS